ncbi:MAG: prolyl oligopeptidase family serine peptidase [Chloroflexota bacterium]|nr:prolyl oligopeptidase family serine peptidase [Chloroflexota bacterium]
MSFDYPETRQVDQIDNYHGTKVSDPYRWLEDTDTPESRAWIEAQNKLTFEYLSEIPERENIQKRLTQVWDYPKASPPVKKGGRYFLLRNSGLQNQDVLYVTDSYDSEGRVLLDPNTLSEDGTVALSNWEPSPDGKYLAYATSDSGSDWMTWRICDVETGEDLPDLIEWSKFSAAAWRKDGIGFYYARYDEPTPGDDYTGVNYYQKLYFHRLGDLQSQDGLIYERPDQKEWGFSGIVSDDGRYLIIYVWQGTDVRNLIFYQDLESDKAVVELIGELEATYDFVGNYGSVFYFRTNRDTPRGRLIAINTMETEEANWRDIIPESEDTLEYVKMVHDEFIALYLHDAHHQLKRFDRDGESIAEIELPTLGSIPTVGYFLYLTGEREHDEMFYGFASFLYPITIFRYDFKRGESEQIFSPASGIDTSEFTTRQVFTTSKDGTQVPMFLTQRRDLVLDGQNKTLLYGYGGFNIPSVPTFDVGRLEWLELGGVLAWANLRGGGEYGEEWHQAGMLDNKQNVFDDFIACAEYLIDENITSTPHLAIMGRSNGGLLVGACLTQRPDLFGAAVPIVGVMDMLRFHKFTIGWAWVSDYGSVEDTQGFKTLYAYSPLHNLKPGAEYPATLVTTGDHDDRVVPGHSFKFTAALQAAQSGEAATLIRIQTKAGHGVGKPTALLIEETADILAFLTHELGG